MAHFKMADQYSTGDTSVELSSSDSKKRPLDGAGDGRPAFKRSNLGGMHSCKKFRCSLCKMRLFLGMCFGHGAMRRQDEISTLLRLSVTVSFSLMRKTI